MERLQHQVVPASGHVPGEAAQQGAEVRGHQPGAQLIQDTEQVAGQLGVLWVILGLEEERSGRAAGFGAGGEVLCGLRPGG